MKVAYTLFAMMAIAPASSLAAISEHNLEAIDGVTLLQPNQYNPRPDYDDIFFDFDIETSFDLSDGYKQLELVLDIKEANITEPRNIDLRITGDFIMTQKLFKYADISKGVSYYGVDVGTLMLDGHPGYGNDLNFSVSLSPYVSNQSEYQPWESVTFGPNSYMRLTNEEEGLFPIPVPETGTFALFMAGLVGLAIRRQQKTQR